MQEGPESQAEEGDNASACLPADGSNSSDAAAAASRAEACTLALSASECSQSSEAEGKTMRVQEMAADAPAVKLCSADNCSMQQKVNQDSQDLLVLAGDTTCTDLGNPPCKRGLLFGKRSPLSKREAVPEMPCEGQGLNQEAPSLRLSLSQEGKDASSASARDDSREPSQRTGKEAPETIKRPSLEDSTEMLQEVQKAGPEASLMLKLSDSQPGPEVARAGVAPGMVMPVEGESQEGSCLLVKEKGLPLPTTEGDDKPGTKWGKMPESQEGLPGPAGGKPVALPENQPTPKDRVDASLGKLLLPPPPGQENEKAAKRVAVRQVPPSPPPVPAEEQVESQQRKQSGGLEGEQPPPPLPQQQTSPDLSASVSSGKSLCRE